MRLVNAFCRLVEIAAEQAGASPEPAVTDRGRSPVAVVADAGTTRTSCCSPSSARPRERRADRALTRIVG